MGKDVLQLKSIELTYFKGVKSLTVDFNEITNIYGDNETYKSTISDAFSWLFFGKNMAGKQNFGIKTLKEGQVIPRVDHSVTASILVNGEINTAKRTLREKWVKKKGSSEKSFEGNETLYWWNDVPKNQSEYKAKITQIFDENVFKLITDPLAFNSLHWEKARQILIDIEPGDGDTIIAKGNKQFTALLEKLNQKSLAEYKTQLKSSKRLIEKELKDIPPRIDEVHKNKPEEADFGIVGKAGQALEVYVYQEKLNTLNGKIEKTRDSIYDHNKALEHQLSEKTKINQAIFVAKNSNQEIYTKYKVSVTDESNSKKLRINLIESEIIQSKSILTNDERHISSLNIEVESYKVKIEEVSKELKSKQVQWNKENASALKFDNDSFTCPTCKKPLDTAEIEIEKQKMTDDFNQDKKSGLESINKQGVAIANKKESLTELYNELKVTITDLTESISEKNKQLDKLKLNLTSAKSKLKDDTSNDEQKIKDLVEKDISYQDNLTAIAKMESELLEFKSVDLSDLKKREDYYNSKIGEVKEDLMKKELIESANLRIVELENSEEKLSKELLEIESEQFICDEFTKAKINSLEGKINARFNKVKFKLYNQLVHGGEEETCVAQYKGVDFLDVNTAGKIEMGLDIINTLCNHYKSYAPIFLDNAEGITNIPTTESQQIRLIVSKNSKLTVE